MDETSETKKNGTANSIIIIDVGHERIISSVCVCVWIDVDMLWSNNKQWLQYPA